MDFSFEKVMLVVDMLGIFAILAERITDRLTPLSPAIEGVIETIGEGVDRVDAARALLMQAFEDDKIDENELKTSAHALKKAVQNRGE